jgi:large subunit ribosomal protein L19
MTRDDPTAIRRLERPTMDQNVHEFHKREIARIEEAKMAAFSGDAGAKAAKAKKGRKQKKRKKVERPYDIQHFEIGDTVDVHYKIIEGDKERVQVFTGTVIREKGSGITANFTVRRIVQGEGVERIFPRFSPKLMKVLVARRGRVRRAKLYYLRDRVGKATRVPELLGPRADARKKKEEERAKALDARYAEVVQARSQDGEGGTAG